MMSTRADLCVCVSHFIFFRTSIMLGSRFIYQIKFAGCPVVF